MPNTTLITDRAERDDRGHRERVRGLRVELSASKNSLKPGLERPVAGSPRPAAARAGRRRAIAIARSVSDAGRSGPGAPWASGACGDRDGGASDGVSHGGPSGVGGRRAGRARSRWRCSRTVAIAAACWVDCARRCRRPAACRRSPTTAISVLNGRLLEMSTTDPYSPSARANDERGTRTRSPAGAAAA